MNVNDQWMLEKMQQMAASMAASLPQTSQNTDTPEAGKGESFKDMMDKAVQDQKTEAPKKAETPQKTEKTEPVQSKEPAQKVQKTQKTVQIDPGTGMRQIDVTPEEAALLVAGYAKLSPPMEDGTVWMVTVQDENGNPVLPLAELEKAKGIVPFGADLFVDTTGEWVLDEITPEFTQALEQLLAKTGDPRSARWSRRSRTWRTCQSWSLWSAPLRPNGPNRLCGLNGPNRRSSPTRGTMPARTPSPPTLASLCSRT